MCGNGTHLFHVNYMQLYASIRYSLFLLFCFNNVDTLLQIPENLLPALSYLYHVNPNFFVPSLNKAYTSTTTWGYRLLRNCTEKLCGYIQMRIVSTHPLVPVSFSAVGGFR